MKKAKKVNFKGLKKSIKQDKPKKTAKKAPRKPVKAKTTNKSTAPAKVRPAKRNFKPKTTKSAKPAQNRTLVAKNTNPERKSPYTVIAQEHFEDISKPATKRTGKQNSKQIKIINIRI